MFKEEKLIEALNVFNDSISSLEDYQAQSDTKLDTIISGQNEMREALGSFIDELKEWKNQAEKRIYKLERESQHKSG